jgi:hypothetical protein
MPRARLPPLICDPVLIRADPSRRALEGQLRPTASHGCLQRLRVLAADRAAAPIGAADFPDFCWRLVGARTRGGSGSGASLFLQRSQHAVIGDWKQPSGQSGALNPSGMLWPGWRGPPRAWAWAVPKHGQCFCAHIAPPHSTRHGRAAVLRAIVDALISCCCGRSSFLMNGWT